MKLNRTSVLAVAGAAALTLGVATHQSTVQADTSMPGDGVEATPSFSVLGELFQTEIVNIGMEKLGYDVQDAREVEYVTMHVALASGDIDYAPVHWENLHNGFYQENGGDDTMSRLTVLVDDTIQGYLIDKESYESGITSIEQFEDPEVIARFDSDDDGKANLTGCNPGWGCEVVIEHHLDEYGLRDSIEHDQGKYDALMADTITRFEQGEPILFYTWTPYWVTGRLQPGEDVEWIEVPFTSLPEEVGEVSEDETMAQGKNLGFKNDRQRIVANNEFLADNPAAAAFLESVQIPILDISSQNLLMQEGEDTPEDIRRHAEEWVSENQEMFDSWIEAAMEAAS